MFQQLNRKQVPPLRQVKIGTITEPQQVYLDNNIPVYLLDVGHQEVVQVRWVFKAGKWYEPQKLVAHATISMLKEGTSNHTTQEISKKIEYYGATFRTKSGNDYSQLELFTLSKHLPKVLHIIKDVLENSVFPEKELRALIRNSKQNLLIRKEKVEYVADETFGNLLFGNKHPYGRPVHDVDYDRLNTNILKDFYQDYYTSGNCAIYISGKLDQNSLSLINKHFGQYQWGNPKKITTPSHQIVSQDTQKVFIPKNDSLQAAIRIGCPLFNKRHPAYQDVFILNTILGGYFGARLMTNLREDKGYTYGIYSTMISMIQSGYFLISAEVKNDVWQDALKEIFSEIKRLKEIPIEVEELYTAKNYLLGTLLSSIDGAFNLASTLQGLYIYDLDISFYHQFVTKIEAMTPDRLQSIAQTYLKEENFLQVIVGGKQ